LEKNKKVISYKKIPDSRFMQDEVSITFKKLIYHQSHFFSFSGRSGLLAIFDIMEFQDNQFLLVPVFIPEGLILPIKRKKINLQFYELNHDFTPNINSIKKLISSFNIRSIILIHYFGINCLNSVLINYIKTNSIYLIEDCAQGFLSQNKNEFLGKIGDVCIFSLNKMMPLPDGALFIITNEDLKKKSIKLYKQNGFVKLAVFFGIIYLFLKKKHINSGIILYDYLSKLFFYFYYRINCTLKLPIEISKYSLRAIMHFNFDKYLEVRKSNIMNLCKSINKDLQNLEVQEGANLLGFPIYFKDSIKLKKDLKKYSIEVLTLSKRWYLFNNIHKTNSKYLNYLLLPINEIYSNEEISKMAEIINTLTK
jgi:hypothetical protein